MNANLTLIVADYRQRTRSYTFLVTLAVTVYAAYSFVPPETSAYTTLSVPGYRGAYNSAWVGYISASMTTVMLSLYGFLLVNSAIKKDIGTEVGLIIAATPISNFNYLLTKLFSNFLVLTSIAGITFAVSMMMFLLRVNGYPFIFNDFIIPYSLFALPALFLVSGFAVAAEVFLVKKGILQFIIYFAFCGLVMAYINIPRAGAVTPVFDPYGLSLVTGSIKNRINTQFHENIRQVSFGFIFSHPKALKTVVWNGVTWTGIFIFSRLIWIGLSLLLVYISSFFFHRFDIKNVFRTKKKNFAGGYQDGLNDIKPVKSHSGPLPPIVADYGIAPFIRTELLLLLRRGSRWFWIITAGAWIAMLFVPLNIAHAYLLPVIWFLQVTRLSELVTKDQAYSVHYFTWASYTPLLRMLPAQILAGIIVLVLLALPVIGRYLLVFNVSAIVNTSLGAALIVLLAVCLGIVSGGKKLFEVLFFMLTYAVVQKIPFTDYLGAVPHKNHMGQLTAAMLILSLGMISYLVRNYQTKHL